MKGIVFVKLSEFVEETFGLAYWDKLIDDAQLASEGIYTSVGLYDDEELFTLIGLISEQKNMATDDIQIVFGQWIFKQLYAVAPPGVHNFVDVFTFLKAVQDVIHVEVKKFNPDALLPEFVFLDESATSLTFEYFSPRKMCKFCEGLVQGLAEHTQQTVSVTHVTCEHKGDENCVLRVDKIE